MFVSIREIEDAILDHIDDIGIESLSDVEQELIAQIVSACRRLSAGDEIKIIDTDIILDLIERKIEEYGIFNFTQEQFNLMIKVLKAIRENLFSLDIEGS